MELSQAETKGNSCDVRYLLIDTKASLPTPGFGEFQMEAVSVFHHSLSNSYLIASI